MVFSTFLFPPVLLEYSNQSIGTWLLLSSGSASPRTGRDVDSTGLLADLHSAAVPSHLPRRWWRFKAPSPACLFVSILPQTRKEAVCASVHSLRRMWSDRGIKKRCARPLVDEHMCIPSLPILPRLPVSVWLCEHPPASLPGPIGAGGKKKKGWRGRSRGFTAATPRKANKRSRVGELNQRADGWDKTQTASKGQKRRKSTGKSNQSHQRSGGWEREADLSGCLSGVNLLKDTQTTCFGMKAAQWPTSP